MPTHQHQFDIPMQVRDYECDTQRVVNNVNYLSYLDHGRQQSLALLFGDKYSQFDFHGHLTVTNVELNYLAPLTLGDQFVIHVILSRDTPHQLKFQQSIVRQSDGKPILNGTLTCSIQAGQEHADFVTTLDQLWQNAPSRA